MSDDRGHELFRRDGLSLEDLAPDAPQRPLPRWVVVAAAALLASLVTVLIASQVIGDDRSASAPGEAALADAYDRGFQAGQESVAPAAVRDEGRAAAASYLRGVEAGRRAALEITVDPYTVSPFLAFAVPLSALDRAYLASCPTEIPEWFFPLTGTEGCDR